MRRIEGHHFASPFGPDFRVGQKQWIHAGDLAEIVGIPTERGAFPVPKTGQFPLGKSGAKATQNGNRFGACYIVWFFPEFPRSFPDFPGSSPDLPDDAQKVPLNHMCRYISTISFQGVCITEAAPLPKSTSTDRSTTTNFRRPVHEPYLGVT